MWLFMSYMQTNTGKQTCLLIMLYITCFLAKDSYLAATFLTFFRSLFSELILNFILFPRVEEILSSKLSSLVVVKGSHCHITLLQCGSTLSCLYTVESLFGFSSQQKLECDDSVVIIYLPLLIPTPAFVIYTQKRLSYAV